MKLGKIVLSIALVVVGLGMYAGSTWAAQQIHLGHWNRPADGDEILVVCPSTTGSWGSCIRGVISPSCLAALLEPS